jgi:MFS family permease
MESRKRQRIALSTYFFITGLFFSTWASRIPSIKEAFDLNEAQLGNLLLTMPISSLIGLPISGWLVAKFESRHPLLAAFFLLSISLVGIGYAQSIWMLIAAISLFAFAMRIFNIAVNTQSITLQKAYEKKIIGSFHGLWSTGGVTGVGISTLMLKLNVSMEVHMLLVSSLCLVVGGIAYPHLLKRDRATAGNKLRLGKPDKFILYLGLLVFFAAICEGGMFDWSGVFFKEVVGEDVFTIGYLIFMIFMALSRFTTDKVIEAIGMPKTYVFSSLLVASGVLLMIVFPYFWPAIIGFCLVGIGVAAIFPMTFLLAGSSEKYSAGMAISIISTYAIAGMLLGPPLVGYIAHLSNLKVSFVLFLISALMFIPISKLFFSYSRTMRTEAEKD